jgi:hypothetical protein
VLFSLSRKQSCQEVLPNIGDYILLLSQACSYKMGILCHNKFRLGNPKGANDVFVLEVNFLDAHWHPKHIILFESTKTRSQALTKKTIVNVLKVWACHYTRLSVFKNY